MFGGAYLEKKIKTTEAWVSSFTHKGVTGEEKEPRMCRGGVRRPPERRESLKGVSCVKESDRSA